MDGFAAGEVREHHAQRRERKQNTSARDRFVEKAHTTDSIRLPVSEAKKTKQKNKNKKKNNNKKPPQTQQTTNNKKR